MLIDDETPNGVEYMAAAAPVKSNGGYEVALYIKGMVMVI